MAYVYENVKALENTDPVGSGQCVALVQHYAGLPNTGMWHEGESVRNKLSIEPGTAIATFVDKVYKSHATGNHAGFYMGQDASGIFIMDQWRGANKPKVSMRHIQFLGTKKIKTKKGGEIEVFIDPSNNADAFSVIE